MHPGGAQPQAGLLFPLAAEPNGFGQPGVAEVFTNERGVLYHSPRIDPGVKYPPYAEHTRERPAPRASRCTERSWRRESPWAGRR